MRLYSYWRSSSSYRIRIVLAWKGIAYEYRAVDLRPDRSEQDEASFEEVNPMRQVPVLEWEHEGITRRLGQSVAIAEYLEETQPRPPLLPEDPLARAVVRTAVEIVNSGIQPHQNVRLLEVLRGASPGLAEEWATAAIARGLFALETLTRDHGRRFLVGDALSLADVFLIPQLYNARRFGVELAHFPRLLEIEHRTEEVDAFARARPEHQPDAPTESPGG